MAHDWERYRDDGPVRSAGSWIEAIFATLVLAVLLLAECGAAVALLLPEQAFNAAIESYETWRDKRGISRQERWLP